MAWKDKEKDYNKNYYETNKKRLKIKHSNYQKANRGKRNANEAKREALKKEAVLPTTNNELIAKIYKRSQKLSEKTKVKHHVDHIIPIHIGGAHHQDNLRVITAKENITKGYEYIPELGGVWADNDLARKTKKKLGIK